MNPLFQSFAKDNTWAVMGAVLNFAKPLILTPLILKSAPVEVFGAYVIVSSLVGLIAGFAPLGSDFNLKRNLPAAETTGAKKDLFYPQFFFQSAVFLVCGLALLLFSMPLKALIFKGAPPFSMSLAVVYLFLFFLYAQFTEYFRYSNRMRYFLAGTVAYPYIAILLVICLRVFHGTFTVDSLIAAEGGALLLISLWLGGVAFKDLGFKSPGFKWGEIRASIALGFPLLLVAFNEIILFSGARYVIAFFLGVSAVGAFAAAVQLGNISLFMPRALGIALPPLLCRAEDTGHKREFSTMLHYAVKGHLFFAVPFFVLTLPAGRELLAAFSNAEVAARAWLLVPAVAGASALYGISLILSKVYVVEKNTVLLLRASVAASLVSAAALIPGVWIAGSILPAGLAILFSYGVMLALILKGNARCSEALAPLPVKRIAAVSAVSVAGAYLLFSFFPASLPGRVFGISGAAVSLYLPISAMTGVFAKNERNFARKLFRAG